MVTGGAGFLGVRLCKQLSGAGVEVVSLDDLSTSSPAAAARLRGRPGYRFVPGDICDPAVIGKVGVAFDTVFPLASPASPLDYQRLPIATLRAGSEGTATALEIVQRGGGRLVLASSGEVYGDPQQHPQHEIIGATSIPSGRGASTTKPNATRRRWLSPTGESTGPTSGWSASSTPTGGVCAPTTTGWFRRSAGTRCVVSH
ncbi:short chain dehydrogenase family protein [Mycobacterium kansasii 732]|nr:short chain dehydrogenase family protein [Mycobacterium kansasii 732]